MIHGFIRVAIRRWLVLSALVTLFFISVCSNAEGRSATDAAPGSPPLVRFTFTEYHMGVDTRLVVYAKDKATAESACSAAFERIAALDAIMSDYQINSELMKLCRRAGQGPASVSPELLRVFLESKKVSSLSNGMFDVTVGPLVRLWRKARKTGVLPTSDEIDAAKKLVDYRRLTIDKSSSMVRLAIPGMMLDLGAIGKGYADDEAQKVLKEHGITRALVDMGGDLVVSDPPPGRRGWTIQAPNAEKGGTIPILTVHNCAVSTSGDTEEFVIIGNRRYSHVIDPHTGHALTQRVQATVVTKEGISADAISTAMTLVNRAGRKRIQRAYPGTKVFVKVLKSR